MKKMGLYAGITLLVILLYGCKGQGNEVIQDSIETETEETAENIQDNAFTVSVSELPCAAKEGKMEENKIAWNVESASVSDSDFTITLGMLFEDFEYYEEEAPTEYEDGWPRNYIGFLTIYGVDHHLYSHAYTDFYIVTSDYNFAINDISGEKIYIQEINLTTPRFCTSRGISVGVTLDELLEAYGEPMKVRYNEPNWIEYSYYDGYVATNFYWNLEEKQITKISLSIVSRRYALAYSGLPFSKTLIKAFPVPNLSNEEDYEEIQDNAFTVSVSELPCAVKEGKAEEKNCVECRKRIGQRF